MHVNFELTLMLYYFTNFKVAFNSKKFNKQLKFSSLDYDLLLRNSHLILFFFFNPEYIPKKANRINKKQPDLSC